MNKSRVNCCSSQPQVVWTNLNCNGLKFTSEDNSVLITKGENCAFDIRISSPVPISKGGTGLSILGNPLQLLRVNSLGSALEYFTPAFLTGLSLTGDIVGTGTSSISTTLSNTAVTPGAYTNANITVDSKGRLTSAANGSAGSSLAIGTAVVGGTTGSVLFAGSSGLSQDNTNFFWDNTSKLLSINTTGSFTTQSVHFFGDSITAGINASVTSNRWTSILSSLWGVTEVNHGVGGSTLEKQTPINPYGSTNMVDLIPNIPVYTTSLKYLVFAYGVNDVGYNAVNYNTTNFTSDYTTIINAAITKGWPTNKIILISPYYIVDPLAYVGYASGTGTLQTNSTRLAAFIAATAALATSFGTLYVDINAAESNSYGATLLSPTDGLHPIDDGYQFIAEYIYSVIQQTTKRNNQSLAINGSVEFSQLKFSNLPIETSSNKMSALIGIDRTGKVTMADANSHIRNNISGLPGTGTINIVGRGYFGNVASPTAPEVVQVNGVTKSTGIRITGSEPSGITGEAVNIYYVGGIGYIYAKDSTANTQKPISISSFGGQTVIGTNGLSGGTEKLYVPGGAKFSYGQFTGTVGAGTTGLGVEIATAFGGGYIGAFDRTSPSAQPLYMQALGGNIGIALTSTPTSKIDINGANGYTQLRLRTSYTPTSTADTNGNQGDFSWDDNFLYIKTSAGWKRSALTTF